MLSEKGTNASASPSGEVLANQGRLEEGDEMSGEFEIDRPVGLREAQELFARHVRNYHMAPKEDPLTCEECGCVIVKSYGGPIVWEDRGEYQVRRRALCRGCDLRLKGGDSSYVQAEVLGHSLAIVKPLFEKGEEE